MIETRIRVRERRQLRRKRRRADERREDERLSGFALARPPNFALLHALLGQRRAYKLLAGLTLLALLSWLVGVVLG